MSEGNVSAKRSVGNLIDAVKQFDHFINNLLNDERPDSFASVAVFSDCFVLSMRPDQVLYLIRETGNLCRYLLLHGLPCRGAIASGSLHHRERIVVGPALVKAYRLEQSVAVYPRVIVDETTLEHWAEEFAPGSAHPHLQSWVKRDRDGQWFIDIFSPHWSDVIPSLGAAPREPGDFLKAAYEPLRQGLANNRNSAKIYAKYAWLASEYNEHARERSLPVIAS